MPRVLNKHKDVIPPDAVYVGRGSPWGNPFRVGLDGPRSVVIKRFEKEVLPHLDLGPLRGKDLVCFCAPKACHATALMKAANEEEQ